MIPHNCTRLVEVISYMEEESSTANSGWFLRYFRTRRTRAERLEFREYTKTATLPLLYSGACVPPNLIKSGEESLNVQEFSFPVIKAKGNITGCDVDEQRIDPKTGKITPVGRQRFNNAFNKEMAKIFEAQKATHILEAITLLKTGGYLLHDTATSNIGALDFNRAEELKYIDLTSTPEAWSEMCSKPMKGVKSIIREMSKYGAISGKIDLIYSPLAWEAKQAHDEREAIKYHMTPADSITQELMNYSDVEFMGQTEGKFNHWVSDAKMINYDGTEVSVLEPGEMMIISRDGFDGQRVFRTITSDNREELPAGANAFVYDNLDKEYKRECRTFNPWMEEYHLMVPRNVNGATVVKVVDEDYEPCVVCEECPE